MSKKRPLPTPLQALAVLTVFLSMACSFTVFLDLPVLLALFFGWFVIMTLGLKLGYRYRELEEAAAFGVFEGMPALLILFAVGAMTGSWIAGGIVPGIIYYGLATIAPSLFLPTALLICSITALCTGTSWGAAGTAGIAMMGIGDGLGIPPALTAGAVLSGVYFGDKLSPLSDSVLLASSMSDVEIRAHIQGMLPISLMAYIITLVLFTITSLSYSGQHDLAHINEIMMLLKQRFDISLLCFVPPGVILILLALRQPAFPVITFGGLLGITWAVLLQGNTPIESLHSIWAVPYVDSDHSFISNLLSRGGMESIMTSVAMIIFGLGFGSLLVKVGVVQLLAGKLESYITNESRLTNCTLLTAFLGNLLGSAMYVSLILTPKLMVKTYDQQKADRRLLSRNTEFGGTLTSGMVPWSDNGTYMTGVLGVATLSYLPFMWLSWISIILAVGVSWTRTRAGKTTTFTKDGRSQHAQSNPLLARDQTL
ncbi:Na+/H+ antiporter NhaC [Sansalvadorimonas sp. 2012CJ34-2]|uniref:Na+/H+ antiporter NhaC n=2 Tax=Parendozoicomonas callyspongiae TaxID=2942213 RepID=A0ABT0PDZ6_9GAMM|nr:Na+/H+ antiporter NhaC [Sansalvadorimonas sp. 2012CJ34-2]